MGIIKLWSVGRKCKLVTIAVTSPAEQPQIHLLIFLVLMPQEPKASASIDTLSFTLILARYNAVPL